MKNFSILIVIFISILLALPVCAQTVTENIVFAVNQDYADQNPNWQQGALEIITFANSVFSKTTNLQYQISRFMTFNPAQYYDIKTDDSFYDFYDTGSTVFGTAIFYWLPTNAADEALVQSIVNNTGARAISGVNSINYSAEFQKPLARYHVSYYASSSANLEFLNVLLGRNYLNTAYGNKSFETYASTFIHELGHSFGLGLPETYMYTYNIDNTAIEPKLAPFLAIDHYGYDPMLSVFDPEITRDYAFNQLSSGIINNNIRHQITTINADYYRDQVSQNVLVEVNNQQGKPIPNALVRVYGSRSACLTCIYDPSVNNKTAPLLQSLYTYSDGQVNIQPTTTVTFPYDQTGQLNQWVTKIVKVTYNNQTLGKYFTTYDLQTNKILYGSNTWKLNFVFNEDTSDVNPPKDDTDSIKEEEQVKPEETRYDFLTTEKDLVVSVDQRLVARLAGYILLQVQESGEAWYLNPDDQQKYYLSRPLDAFTIMRNFGLGINKQELAVYLTDGFPSRLSGKIMLDVENHGEAYYVYPKNLQGYYMGRPADAFNLMQQLSLGISNTDIRKIGVGDL